MSIGTFGSGRACLRRIESLLTRHPDTRHPNDKAGRAMTILKIMDVTRQDLPIHSRMKAGTLAGPKKKSMVEGQGVGGGGVEKKGVHVRSPWVRERCVAVLAGFMTADVFGASVRTLQSWWPRQEEAGRAHFRYGP